MSERPRRAGAGANMAKLMVEEDNADDFYKTAYGGFEEEESDREYTTEQEQSDIFDSDFDAPEVSDAPVSNDSNDEVKKKRKTWEVKRPVIKLSRDHSDKKEEKKKQPAPAVVLSVSRRSTTAIKSEISKIRRDHEQKTKVKRKVPKKEWRVPTQEEILEEARLTEEKNLELLDAFRRREEQKKKRKATKRSHMGAYIRYHSIAAPIVKLGVGTSSSPQHGAPADHKVTALRYCTRNFITFSDPRIIPSFLQRTHKSTAPEKLYCPVTRLPAKYMDPLTLTPYATTKAYKMIRDSFASYEDLRRQELNDSTKRSRKKED